MGLLETMTAQYGADALKRQAVSAAEFYEALDAMTEAFKGLKARLDVFEAEKSQKPRIRVPAESSRHA